MEVIKGILDFLHNCGMQEVANVMREEWLGPKRDENNLAKILREAGVKPSDPETNHHMQNLLRKLLTRQQPRQPLESMQNLPTFARLIEKKKVSAEPVQAPVQNPPPALQPENSKPLIEDDELFGADIRQEPSTILQQSNASFGAVSLDEEDAIDEYEDDDDPGFALYRFDGEDFATFCKEIANKYGFPARGEANSVSDTRVILAKDEREEVPPKGNSKLPGNIKFAESKDEYYPVEFGGTVYDTYKLKVICDREKTGFEETKDFQIVIGSVIAGRYLVKEYLGSAAFSKAIQCQDLHNNQLVCLKIIENNKDYVDQSIDEIKLLYFINSNGDPDEKNVLRAYDCFYHKEHLFIVTELLRDNLYEFSKYNREHEEERYFTIGRLQRVAYQVLIALEFLHSLHLIHCDLKPENILIKSYSRCEVKVIDFGSTCFIHDHLGSYVQSRSYRAPEVIMGCPYDYRVDIWSLGCILAELWTGNVLFQNDSVQALLARIMSIMGPFPESMYKSGRHTDNFFTKDRIVYLEVLEEDKNIDNRHLSEEMIELIKRHRKPKKRTALLVPKKTSLKARLRTDDGMFLDFVKCLLEVDKDKRPSATEALRHPWITECKYSDGLV
jgi:serine/threonine protein kinase